MTCQKEWVREILPEYLALRLTEERARAVRDHLEDCSECRQQLKLIKSLADEPVPEPPAAFWKSTPEKVTSSVRDREHRSFRYAIPVWAGGLAAAAMVVLLIISPWKHSVFNVEIPGEFYAGTTTWFGPGLEEEILLISGLDAAELGRSLERNMISSDDISGFENFRDDYQSGFFEGMDDDTLKKFEKLIDEVSPISS